MIRVFIVDDHELVRVGLRSLLGDQPDITVVGEASSAVAAIESIPPLNPDVVLCDYHLPDGTGLSIINALLDADSGLKILVVSMVEDPEIPRRLLAAGAMGFVSKESGATVVRAVRRVAAGQRFVEFIGSLEQVREWESPSSPLGPLSPREVDVLRLLLSGHSYKSISMHLGIKVNSVKTHRSRAFEKLGIRSRIELLQWARSVGWAGVTDES
ncbi:response regulator transcription factor [Lysobacter sp. ISL-50]|uniref:response regulator transcription factor n=1 Tax=unclassified Lysobacter TaxID=2635362 RepID=UPI001BE938D3|nr:response regulator transcription factor [Lysobacter sp. ISL-50]MBT2775393.1 response regulator transcription factor [Lysobacter sp. ISL-54]MBT2783516.1 response regulator transcription factor [Lysobacter sp. ISL-52]